MKKITNSLFTKALSSTRLFAVTLLMASLFFVDNAFGQIAARTAGTGTSTGTTLTITKPSGLAVGDLMIANIVTSDNSNGTLSNSSLTGWTLITGREFDTSSSSSYWGTLLYKVATESDVAATNFTFSLDAQSTSNTGGIVAFSGVAVTGGVSGGPFDVAPGTISIANSSTASATAVTTVTASAAVVMFGMVADDDSFSSWSTATAGALTELFDNDFNSTIDVGAGAAWRLRTGTGTTGTGTASVGATDYNGAIILVLRPCTTSPTITSTGVVAARCLSASSQTSTMPYTATTGTPTSYDIDWNAAANTAGLDDQGITANTFVAGSGTISGIEIPASLAAGTYTGTMNVITAGGCRGTKTITLTINSVTVSAGTAFTKTCIANTSGATIGEANVSGNTYSWSPSTGLSNAGISNPIANPATTTTYTVTKTNNTTLCSAQASVTVTVDNATTTVSVNPGFTKTCTTNPVGLAIGEANDATATYSWTPTTGLTGPTTSNPTANPTTTTTYTVVKTKTGSGCTATAQVTVTVNTTAPTVNAGSAFTKTCVANINGASIGEANDPSATYSWSPSTGLSATNVSNPFANPATTQTYTVTKTSTANGCTATAQVTVTVDNTVTAAAGADFTKTCTTNPTGKQVGETSVAGFTYSWSPTTGITGSSTVSNPTLNPTATTTYTVTKTKTSSGCVDTDSIVVTVDTTTPDVCVVTPFTKTCVTNPTGATIGEANDGSSTYLWSPNTNLSSTSASNPTANPSATTTYTVRKTNPTSGCFVTTTVTVTVNTTVPTVAALTGTQSVCAGSTTTFSSATNGGVWSSDDTNIATVTGGVVTGVSAGTTAINYTVTGANGCTTTVSRTVTVNPLPAAIVASGAATICNGSSTALTGSAVIPYTQIATINEDTFNGTPTYTTSGGFSQKSNNATVASTAMTNNIDASSFMAAGVTASFGTSSVTSTLTSPVISTIGYSAPITLTFNHTYNKGNSGTQSAIVEVFDGTTWTTVKSYTSDQGGDNNFASESINLDAYANVAALQIRFSSVIGVSLFQQGWWVIDNPTLKGSVPVNALYSWTADTASGVNGLPGGAATASIGNASISVNPSATTNYTLTVTDPITGCTKDAATAVAVIVKPMPTATAPSNEIHCNGEVTSAITLSGTPSGVTFDISGGSAIGLADAAGVTTIPSFATIAGSATISITPKLNGCTGTTVTYNMLVNPTPSVTAPANQNYCGTVQAAAITLSGSPSGVTYDISGGAAVGLSNATGLTAIPQFIPTIGNATVTITPKANGCTGTAVTYNITVNPLVLPTFSPVASICAGASLSALPTTSNNGINGTWSPALDNTATTTYTFTPNSGECGLTTTLSITVNSNTTYYADTDNDGFGDAANSVQTCLGLPTGYVKNDTDCAPADATKWRTGNFYVDADNDGFYNGNDTPVSLCYGNSTPSGYVSEIIGADCNDSNAEINANHVEVLGNGADDNCDGNIDELGPISYVIAAQCGMTMTDISNTIYAYGNNAATGYRFHVVNGTNVRDYDSPVSRFILGNLTGGPAYGTTYMIQVSLRIGGFWQAYGPTCSVTTPASPATTNITAAQCGTTLTLMANTIYCNTIPAANHYRFEVTGGTQGTRTYDSPQNNFSMVNLAGPSTYGATYVVRVAVRLGSVWQAYGAPCNITTPATPPTTNLIPSQCGITISNSWTSLYCTPVADVQGYRFEVKNGAQTRFYDTTNSRFNLYNISGGPTAGTLYTIRVAILFGNVYQAYGTACTVTTASVITRQSAEPIAVFDVKSYPNPYAYSFKLDLNTSSEDRVEVKVYDMLGRQIEANSFSVAELGEKEIGSNYPSGVYNIIVSQGDQVKTLRVIKR